MPEEVEWLTSGDGGLLVLLGPPDRAISVAVEFDRLISEYNRAVADENAFRYRYAVNCGNIVSVVGELGKQVIGSALSDTQQILNSANKRLTGQLLSSDAYLHELGRTGAHLRFNFIRLKDVLDQSGSPLKVWNVSQEPGIGARALQGDLHVDPLEREFTPDKGAPVDLAVLSQRLDKFSGVRFQYDEQTHRMSAAGAEEITPSASNQNSSEHDLDALIVRKLSVAIAADIKNTR